MVTTPCTVEAAAAEDDDDDECVTSGDSRRYRRMR